MRQSHWAPLISRPSCLGREIGRNDLLVQRRRHGAWTRIDVYRSANNGGDEAGRKARRGSVFQTRSARIYQHDAAVTPAGRSFDKPTDRFEYFRRRVTTPHQFEQLLLTGEQGFSTLAFVDIRSNEVPKDDMPVLVS